MAAVHGSTWPAKRIASPPGLTSFSRSGRNHSTCPMAIGVRVRMHTPWHWLSCGHTRPVTSGRGLIFSINSSAWRNRPVPTSSIICGMWIRTGQPPVIRSGSPGRLRWMPTSHGFSAHCLSRSASSHTSRSTSRAVKPSVMYPR